MEEINWDGDFPEADAANAGSLFTTAEGGVFICEWSDEFGEYVWVGFGPTWFTPDERDGDTGQ